jgi:hypothetical protein
MTRSLPLSLAVLAATTLALPSSAAAQSQYCLDFVAEYCGPLAVNECIVPDLIAQEVPAECLGDVQMLYEMAQEADEQFYEEQSHSDTGSTDEYDTAPVSAGEGASYGGNLREGPGDEYAVVGSLPESSFVVLEPSGVWSGDYQWFWVTSDYGSAYHWGGLICSYNQYVDGVLDVC